MRQVSANGFIRINKKAAKDLYESGANVYAVPCNIKPSTSSVIVTNNKTDGTFEQWINGAMYYNCNKETGKELWFYKKAQN